ncbi:MAG TPA: FkbM family methyltransferase [Segetibacter sp.]|jgi:FkbM family methyltransferase
MLEYLKASLRRKIARRITKEYPPKVDKFHLKDIGVVEFANWDNPLTGTLQICSDSIAFFKQFIKEGDLAIDIGANIGDTTVPIALAAGASGLTLGFDPNPYVFKILQKNASLNKDKTNIEPIPYAISEREKEFYFISSEASFSNGGISKTKESKHGKFIYPHKIKGVNLKNFLEENYNDWLAKFSFIKIDAEGYDKKILKSIKDLITVYKPTIIAESFGGSSDAEKIELYEVIEQLGYDVHYFEDFNINAKVQKLIDTKDITKYKQTINIYATPKK